MGNDIWEMGLPQVVLTSLGLRQTAWSVNMTAKEVLIVSCLIIL
jgi:hypothetical protein